MGNIIHLLPDHVANQIAAGEVVQRPASVVKELLENAIDAGATSVELVVKDAGKTLIQVIDNGKGMTAADLRMAFERHATSKISKAEDLFDLHTMGFRGEALASIAAVAQVEAKTRLKSEDLGHELHVAAGKVELEQPTSCKAGTQFKVKNLFFNLPARRNFLKSDTIELRHITDEFQHVALAHPEVDFKMEHNGQVLFELKSGGFRQRIVGIMGNRYNEKLVPVREETPYLILEGFIGKPEFAKKMRGEQFTFANLRYIRSQFLHHAILEAYEDLLPTGHHPSYFLYLQIHPKHIDVNIHPTKTEIKFDDDKAVYGIVRSAIKHALGQFNIAPSLDFERELSFDLPHDPTRPVVAPQIKVDPTYNPFRNSGSAEKKESAAGIDWASVWSAQHTTVDHQEEPASQETIPFTGSENVVFLALGKKYLLTRMGGNLMVFHVRRAHERIHYEHYLRSLDHHAAASQQLLFPQQLPLGSADAQLLKELAPQLHELGFDLEFSPQLAHIQGIPVGLHESEAPLVLQEILEDVKNNRPDFKKAGSEYLAKQLARSAAARNNMPYGQEEMEHLISQLFSCIQPYLGLSGKPIVVNISPEELDKHFA